MITQETNRFVITDDGQYLFACIQAGRMPSRAFYMVPDGYRLGSQQQKFPEEIEIGRRFYASVKKEEE